MKIEEMAFYLEEPVQGFSLYLNNMKEYLSSYKKIVQSHHTQEINKTTRNGLSHVQHLPAQAH
jgi:hypothetical protein